MQALDWLKANPALVTLFAYVLTGVLTATFKPRSDAEWAAMNPYLAATLKFFSAIGLDPVKLVESLVTLLRVQGDGSPTMPTIPPPPAPPPGNEP